MVGCGGGGGGSNPPPPPNKSVGGIWTGVTPDGLQVIGLITEAGQFHFLQEDGVQYFGTMTVSNQTSISGTFTGYTPIGTSFPDGATRGSGTFTGTVTERAVLTGTTDFTSANGGHTVGPLTLHYESLYDRDSSLAMISGNFEDVDGVVVNINNGVVFAQDAVTHCVINGSVSVIDTQFNAYRVQYTYSSCIGSDAILNGVNFDGLATLDNTSPPDEYIVAGVTAQVGNVGVSIIHVLLRT